MTTEPAPTLQFLVMVTPMTSDVSIVDELCRVFPAARRLKPHSFNLEGNWFELWPNHDADEEKARDPDEGYLYFDGRLEATPMGSSPKEADQIDLARRVLGAVRELGMRAVLCAAFEDRVEDSGPTQGL